jgi:hypothetical protein
MRTPHPAAHAVHPSAGWRPHPPARRLAGLRPRRPALPLAAALVSLLLAGCGSARTVTISSHRLPLTLQEYRILPQSTSVPTGPLRIVACNRGVLTHNVALQRGSLDSEERITLTGIPTLLPGRCGAVTTSPLAPGRYLLTSTVGNQAVLGMAATLIVR